MNVNPFSYLIEKLKGKVDKSGDTMSGNLTVQVSGNAYAKVTNTNTSIDATLNSSVSGQHGLYSNGYNDGTFHDSGKWLINRQPDGSLLLNGNVEVPSQTGTLALKSDIWILNGHTLPHTGQATFDADTRSARSIVIAIQITDGNGNWYNFAQGNTGAYGQFSGGSPICYVTDNTFYDKDCRAIMLLVS